MQTGYTMLCEQTPPRQLVQDLTRRSQDADEAAQYAARQWAWSSAGWKVMAELPSTSAFAAYSGFVGPGDVTRTVPCGPDAAPYLAAVRAYRYTGFTHVALVQVGAERQADFFSFAEKELLPELRWI